MFVPTRLVLFQKCNEIYKLILPVINSQKPTSFISQKIGEHLFDLWIKVMGSVIRYGNYAPVSEERERELFALEGYMAEFYFHWTWCSPKEKFIGFHVEPKRQEQVKNLLDECGKLIGGLRKRYHQARRKFEQGLDITYRDQVEIPDSAPNKAEIDAMPDLDPILEDFEMTTRHVTRDYYGENKQYLEDDSTFPREAPVLGSTKEMDRVVRPEDARPDRRNPHWEKCYYNDHKNRHPW